ncbi:MAG: hypothetical protein J2P18_05210 [Nocardia sp.]|nr:hypothetical protein [Nocardia sp.]
MTCSQSVRCWCKQPVNAVTECAKKPSTSADYSRNRASLTSAHSHPDALDREVAVMSVVVFTLITVLIFALFGLLQRGLERL